MDTSDYKKQLDPSTQTLQPGSLPYALIGFFKKYGKTEKVEPRRVVATTQRPSHVNQGTVKKVFKLENVPLQSRNANETLWSRIRFSSAEKAAEQPRLQDIKTSNDNTLALLERANVPREAVSFLFFEDKFLSGPVGIILSHAINANNMSGDNESSREKHRKDFFNEAAKFAVSLFHDDQTIKGRQVLSGLIREYPDLFDKWPQEDVTKQQLKEAIGPSLSEILTDENHNIQVQDLLQIVTIDELVSEVKDEKSRSSLCQKLQKTYIPNETNEVEFSNAVLRAFEQQINTLLLLKTPEDTPENSSSNDDLLFDEYRVLNIPPSDQKQLEKDLPRWLDVVFFEDTSLLKQACRFITDIKSDQNPDRQEFLKKWMNTISVENKDQILDEIYKFADSKADFEKETEEFNAHQLETLKKNFSNIGVPSMLLSFLFAQQLKELLQVNSWFEATSFIRSIIKGFTQSAFARANMALADAYRQIAQASEHPTYCMPIIQQPKIKIKFLPTPKSSSIALELQLILESSSKQIPMINVYKTEIAYDAVPPPKPFFQLTRDFEKPISDCSYEFKINFLLTMNELEEITVNKQGGSAKVILGDNWILLE